MNDEIDEEFQGASIEELMFHSIQSGNIELLEEILNGGEITKGKKPNLESKNSIGDTPILSSLRFEQLECFNLLLNEEVDVDEGNEKKQGERPLHLALTLSELNQIEWVIGQLLESGSNPNLKNFDNLKPIDLLSSSKEFDKIRKLLREAEGKSQINQSDIVNEDEDENEQDEGPPSDEE